MAGEMHGAAASRAFLDILWRNRPEPPLRPEAPLSELAGVIDRAVALERAGDDLAAGTPPMPEVRDWRTPGIRLYRHRDGWRLEIAMERWHWVVLDWMESARGHGLSDILAACEAHRGDDALDDALRFYTQEYLCACVRHYGDAHAIAARMERAGH